MDGIPFILDEKSNRLGIERWISIFYDTSPHVIWAGRTGSGKTVGAKILIARTILLAPPELQPVELTVIDPKEDIDFQFLDGLPRFYRGDEAPRGFNDFYAAYIERKERRDLTRNLKIMFTDEVSSLFGLIEDKKEKEAAQRKLNLLLSLSRSRRCSVQLAVQQPSARIFGEAGSASREQFGCVCLIGDSGTETEQMLFDGDSRERMKEYGSIGSRAVGWLSVNGGIAQPVRIPFIENMDKLNAVIRDNLME